MGSGCCRKRFGLRIYLLPYFHTCVDSLRQTSIHPPHTHSLLPGYVGVIYPGADVRDVAPEWQVAFPNATMALIMARAHVASRSLDFLLASASQGAAAAEAARVRNLHLPSLRADQVAVTGHSRNGKQSLVFAAFDDRVTAVVGSSPGAPIASPFRFTTSNFYGEGPLVS